MATLLVRNAEMLVTMDAGRREIAGGGIFARDGVIEVVGADDVLPQEADRVIDAGGMLVLPGLVNTHHHFFQSLTRALPAAQDAGLFDWLVTQYPIWARLDGEAIYASARTVLAELALSGCTTASDHLYLFPNGARLDDEIRAAREIGVRLHACRGSMSLGESEGGLPPDAVIEDEEEILRDCQRVYEEFHEPERYGMVRIVIAPCAPFNVSEDLMRRSVEFARERGLTLHTTSPRPRRGSVLPAAYRDAPGGLHALSRVDGARRLVGARRVDEPRGGGPPRRDAHRRGALSLVEHAARLGRGADPRVPGRRRARGARGGRLRLERLVAPLFRGAPGAPPPAGEQGGRRPERPRGVGDGHPRRGRGARARRHRRPGPRDGGRPHRRAARPARLRGRRPTRWPRPSFAGRRRWTSR